MIKRIAFFSLFLISMLCVAGKENLPASRHKERLGQNPVISDILSAVSKDSLASYMESMAGMGTRYMYAENRREVAAWIAAKFLSFGLTEVKLDSFRMAGDTVLTDSVWQYNVVATIEGISAPEEITLIGAHHDDYANPDPYQAPGADDNASGCAVALEIARVIKAKGFNPESTIRFVTFAAEELVGYKFYTGSLYEAEKSVANKDDLRLVLCNDMVANSTGSSLEIFFTDIESGFSTWTGELTLTSAATYSTLNMVPGSYPVSDATFFFDLGFPAAGFQEYGLNPTYHTIHDSVSNCIMELCTEVAKANAAVILNEQLNPVPQYPVCKSGKLSITISWKPTSNANVAGYRIYRSLFSDSLFVQLGQTKEVENDFTDSTVIAGSKYYYRVTSFNQAGFESSFSNTVYGAIAPKDRDLLIVKDSKGGFNNPVDSTVVSFYNSIFKDLESDLSDASESDSLELQVLGRYRKIFWLSNAFSDQSNSSFLRHQDEIFTYLTSGGQLFIAGFQPSFLIKRNNKMQMTFQPSENISRYYKIQKVERKPSAALNGAYPVPEDYDSIWIDPAKCPANSQGHVINVECITPTGDATLVYRFNSAYDTSTSQGKMKGKPVGLEYLGDDYRLIIQSVPLYYLDFASAKYLAEFVVKEKFKTTTGIPCETIGADNNCFIRNQPNPSTGVTTVTYGISESSTVIIEVINISGRRVLSLPQGWKEAGSYSLQIKTDGLAAGIYHLVVKTKRFTKDEKMVVI